MATPRKPPPKPAASVAAFTAAIEEPVEKGVEEPFEKIAEEYAEASVNKADEIQASVRKVAEQSLEQSRTAYDRLRAVAEEATGSIETSCTAAAKGLHEFNTRAIDALKCNADATFDLMKALMAVKTFSEAITLQTEHARKQFEALTAQTKELTEIAKKVAVETTEPLKTSVTKTFGKAA